MLRLILGLFLVFMLLLWVTNWLLYFAKMGLSPNSVISYYRGDESRFLQPRSFQGLSETAHFHMFAMGILVLTLTHLLLFLPISLALKGWLVVGTFAAALFEECSGWLVRFVHPQFALLKIASFLALQGLLAGLIVLILYGIAKPDRNAYRDTESS